RPGCVGWFDSVVVRHARRASGITDLSLNSIDVLSGLDTVKICTAYEIDGKEITEYPATLSALNRAKPVYKELPGWKEDITCVKHLDELPENALNYLRALERLCDVNVFIFSVGPDRHQTNLLKAFWAYILI